MRWTGEDWASAGEAVAETLAENGVLKQNRHESKGGRDCWGRPNLTAWWAETGEATMAARAIKETSVEREETDIKIKKRDKMEKWRSCQTNIQNIYFSPSLSLCPEQAPDCLINIGCQPLSTVFDTHTQLELAWQESNTVDQGLFGLIIALCVCRRTSI